MTYYTIHESPIGPLFLVSDGEALTGLYMISPVQPGSDWSQDDRATPFPEVKDQLTDYFSGRLTGFNVPVRLQGTPFQQRVWQELKKIPYGGTVSYGDIAKSLGQPAAVRAVGAANGQNPVSIIIPCHRVIGANGRLVGYGGGLARKEALLALEKTHTPAAGLNLLSYGAQ